MLVTIHFYLFFSLYHTVGGDMVEGKVGRERVTPEQVLKMQKVADSK